MTSRRSNWLAAACMTCVSCAAYMADAQDGGPAGIVRISDRRTQATPASFHGHNGYGYGGCPVEGCPTGYGCPTGNCQNGYCPGGCPECFGGLFREHYCKNSPDYGYSVPAKYPLHRRGVQYTTYFPNQWYGTPGASYAGGFPMVYQPTDTAQMGYSYQHVPFWQPSATIMPARPVPAQWHIVAPTVNASTFHGSGWTGYAPYGQYTPPFGGYAGVAAHYGSVGYYGNGGMVNQGCPVNQNQSTSANPANGNPGNQTPKPLNQPPDDQAPVPVDGPQTGVPPIPRQFEDSAESGHIRRAFY